MEPPLAAGYFADVLAGLEYLHLHLIAHRDLKPEVRTRENVPRVGRRVGHRRHLPTLSSLAILLPSVTRCGGRYLGRVMYAIVARLLVVHPPLHRCLHRPIETKPFLEKGLGSGGTSPVSCRALRPPPDVLLGYRIDRTSTLISQYIHIYSKQTPTHTPTPTHARARETERADWRRRAGQDSGLRRLSVLCRRRATDPQVGALPGQVCQQVLSNLGAPLSASPAHAACDTPKPGVNSWVSRHLQSML